MNLKIKKGTLKGEANIRGSKSYAHRYLIASFLSFSKSLLKNVPMSRDVLETLNALKSLGASYEMNGNEVLADFNGLKNEIIKLDASASTLRFIIPIALALNKEVKIELSDNLLKRGIDEYLKIFDLKGIQYNIGNNELSIKGTLKPGKYRVSGDISSQYVTGLLFALSLLNENSLIELIPPVNSRNYIGMTLHVLNDFKIDFKYVNNEIYIKGNQKYIVPEEINIEGDYSNAAFIDAFNHFGSDIIINGLNPMSLQGDRKYKEYFELLDSGIPVIDLSDNIDLAPVLFTYAALKNGGIFKGTERLRYKESDRISSMKEELSKIGASFEVKENMVIVSKYDNKIKNVCFNSHGDHRVVMALSLVSSLMDIEIDNAQDVNKSYPEYFDVLKSLGALIEY